MPRHVYRLGAARKSSGSSLMEMVVVLAILSLLAAMASPYARLNIKRDKELELRETLRTVRMAIDRFHMEAQGSTGKKLPGVSGNGYPLTLQVLVEGIEKVAGDGKRRRYLRSLPRNPFARAGAPFEAQWTFVSYQREAPGGIASSSYGMTLAEAQKPEKDIYDLHPVTPEVALDGTPYADW